MDCLCDGNLQSLVISGQPTAQELQTNWFSIYSEFVDMSYSTDKKAIIKLAQDILQLKCKIRKIHARVKFLAAISIMPIQDFKKHGDEYIQELKSWNFRYEYDPTNQRKFSSDLNMIMTRTKGMEMELALMEDEQESYNKNDVGEVPDRVYFTRTLTRLAKWQGGGRFDPEKLTVAEYCFIKSDYHEYIEDLKKKKDAKH